MNIGMPGRFNEAGPSETAQGHRPLWLVILFGAAAVAAVLAPHASARAQSTELSILADKGAYTVGDVATVRVSGLNECAGQTVRLGFRSVGNGAAVFANDVLLDAGGNGSTQLTLTSDNGGLPVQAAAWGDCVSRGFEPGLALDPHPQLISIVPPPVAPLPPATGSGMAANREGPGIALVAGLLLFSSLAGALLTTRRKQANRG